eukprot:scaffold237_cov421-Prasinococcus_capsulatus_cf.AAC.19
MDRFRRSFSAPGRSQPSVAAGWQWLPQERRITSRRGARAARERGGGALALAIHRETRTLRASPSTRTVHALPQIVAPRTSPAPPMASIARASALHSVAAQLNPARTSVKCALPRSAQLSRTAALKSAWSGSPLHTRAVGRSVRARSTALQCSMSGTIPDSLSLRLSYVSWKVESASMKRACLLFVTFSAQYLEEDMKGKLVDSVDTFIFDCDGVIWKGDTLIDGVPETLEMLRSKGKRLIFVTNNSTKSRKQYLKKFLSLGLQVNEEEVFSSSFAAAAYLKFINFEKKVYVVGEEGIQQELDLAGIKHIGGPVRSPRV